LIAIEIATEDSEAEVADEVELRAAVRDLRRQEPVVALVLEPLPGVGRVHDPWRRLAPEHGFHAGATGGGGVAASRLGRCAARFIHDAPPPVVCRMVSADGENAMVATEPNIICAAWPETGLPSNPIQSKLGNQELRPVVRRSGTTGRAGGLFAALVAFDCAAIDPFWAVSRRFFRTTCRVGAMRQCGLTAGHKAARIFRQRTPAGFFCHPYFCQPCRRADVYPS
jgi:hypothetical protein